MLVLSRKLNESIRIGEDVYVTLVRIQADKVRLAFTAPRDVTIVRTELDRRPEANNKQPPPRKHE